MPPSVPHTPGGLVAETEGGLGGGEGGRGREVLGRTLGGALCPVMKREPETPVSGEQASEQSKRVQCSGL